MKASFSKGIYPVMLTPFTEDNKVDYDALGKLIDWYIAEGVDGLFADCQSSEIFFLTEEERIGIAEFVVKHTAGRVPVVASGHVSDEIGDQISELNKIAATGVDALILITNRLAKEDESDEVWIENLKALIAGLPEELPLGFYECPYPYKRLLTEQTIRYALSTDRFYFLKDTSCDIANMKMKLDLVKGTHFSLYNANVSTLLESLQEGAAGFSGVMANFHPYLYKWLFTHFESEPEKARILADELTMMSLIECRQYPTMAKYYQKTIGNFSSYMTRVKDPALLNATGVLEVEQLVRIQERLLKEIR